MLPRSPARWRSPIGRTGPVRRSRARSICAADARILPRTSAHLASDLHARGSPPDRAFAALSGTAHVQPRRTPHHPTVRAVAALCRGLPRHGWASRRRPSARRLHPVGDEHVVVVGVDDELAAADQLVEQAAARDVEHVGVDRDPLDVAQGSRARTCRRCRSCSRATGSGTCRRARGGRGEARGCSPRSRLRPSGSSRPHVTSPRSRAVRPIGQ